MLTIRKFFLLLVCAMVLTTISGPCFGQDKYPSRPIQGVVPFAAGGAHDLTARTVEKYWTKYSPQPLIIINKPGAGGVLGEEFVVRAKPDGYTLYFGQGAGHDLVMPHLQKMPFDPLKDITPVARISIHSVVVCVSGKSPINSMKDLIDYAKKGNKITASVTTAYGSNDLVMRAISKITGIQITTVPFSGGAESTTALAGGHLTMGAALTSEVWPHIKAGRFKAIGVALDKRNPVLPKVPTLREQGIDVATWGSVSGVAVPNGTPPEIIEFIAKTLKKVTEDPEYKKTMASVYQPVMYLGTKEWAAFLQKASKDYADLIRALGIKI